MEEKVIPEVEPKDPTVVELLAQINKLREELVPKAELEKAREDNSKLIKQLTEVRPSPATPQAVTPKDIIKRIEGRVANLENSKSSYESIKSLTENYRDMEKLGMNLEHVDTRTVEFLEQIITDSNGDPVLFKAHMESRIKNK